MCCYDIVEIKFLVPNGTLFSALGWHTVYEGHAAKNVRSYNVHSDALSCLNFWGIV